MPIKVGILGSGNIGTDLIYKIQRSPSLEVGLVAGIDPNSDGLARARAMGIPTSTESIDAILADESIKMVFDATSARAHLRHAPLLKKAGKIAIDLTPASVGEPVVPVVNLNTELPPDNISLITCGAQATVPMVHAVSRVTPVAYAEVVATVASRSAGPGTRQNIDEFTRATARAQVKVGGAKQGKALIILNPADPPILMTDTIYALVPEATPAALEQIEESVNKMVAEVQRYVPGYRLKVPPLIEDSPTGTGKLVTIMIQVEGAGDYLPKYAGNLDIITAAAVAVAERVAAQRLAVSGQSKGEGNQDGR